MGTRSSKTLLRQAIGGVARALERIAHGVSGPQGYDGKVRLLGYAGYRNRAALRLRGRVVRHSPALDSARRWARFRAMLAIYNSRELPGVRVRLTGYGETVEAVTDAEGYFDFALPIAIALPPHTAWEQVSLTTPDRTAQQTSIAVPVIAPGEDHNWGVISDIDDTVIETGATDFLRNWRRVLIEQPGDRLAVPGAATLYRMIAGNHAAPTRPFFYVSSSPWNLYGFLTEFMELNGIPHGPMFLKDYGIDRTKFVSTGHAAHKLAAIETVLAFYPDFRFLLIGDNGQRDVAIYAQAVADYGTRIGGVAIRDVGGSCRSGPNGSALAGIEARGVPVFCGASFADAVSVFTALDLTNPVEAASAVGQQALDTPA